MTALKAYKEASITTQSRERLVVMLYDGAIRFLKTAVSRMEDGDLSGKSEFSGKAIAIVNELNLALDMEIGGQIAANLRQLYFYMIKRINQGSIQNDSVIHQEVIGLLEELNSGWKAISA